MKIYEIYKNILFVCLMFVFEIKHSYMPLNNIKKKVKDFSIHNQKHSFNSQAQAKVALVSFVVQWISDMKSLILGV